MDTPICDFVGDYCRNREIRFHMPGHKGKGLLGFEELDITEICGADSLYEASGIIAQSEKNASELFSSSTFYSTEGSSLCIRAMLYLCMQCGKNSNKKPLVFAGRNAHKAFVSAAALLDLEVEWICKKDGGSYLSCDIDSGILDDMLKGCEKKPCAVYITSPDYLGNTVDIEKIAEVCHRYNVLLAVDNAHGAYLKFLEKSQHPIDLGADICCDSAHKTLPVLTGGAYLHISHSASVYMREQAKNALALFGSTSPSYLVLQSLDKANVYLSEGYGERLSSVISSVNDLKQRLGKIGFGIVGNEPMKITLATKCYGYTGTELSEILFKEGIICEFCDPDHIVFMPSTETAVGDLQRLETVLTAIPRKQEINEAPPPFLLPERVMNIRQAVMGINEKISVDECLGRVAGNVTVGCPPAVPIVVCGERIDRGAIECFKYYGINECSVIRK